LLLDTLGASLPVAARQGYCRWSDRALRAAKMLEHSPELRHVLAEPMNFFANLTEAIATAIESDHIAF